MSEFKNFKKPEGMIEDILILTTSGAGCRIGSEWTPVVDGLWKYAYAEGAISEDMKPSAKGEDTKRLKEQLKLEAEEKLERLKAILTEMYHNPNGNVNKDGTIILRKVIAKYGEAIDKEVVNSLWSEIVENKG